MDAESVKQLAAVSPPINLNGSNENIVDIKVDEKLAKIKTKLEPKLKALEDALAVDPWVVENWVSLVTLCVSQDPVYVRDVFERAVSQFPTSSYMWIQFGNYEYKMKNLKSLESIFSRCLKTAIHVDIWKFYLSYVKQINIELTPNPSAEQRMIVVKAYEFALSFIGLDVYSSSIWVDFLEFVKSSKPENLYEEQQKMDLLRSIYQRAICIPIQALESIWKEYDAFENNLNKLTAKKILSEKSPSYMKARACLKDLEQILGNVNRNSICGPFQWNEREYEQVRAWKRWIDWELRNPLHLDSFFDRASFAYKQATQFIGFYPAIWRDFSSYLLSQSKIEEAEKILEEASRLMPDCLSINFTLADIMEKQGKEEAVELYENLVSYYDSNINSLLSLKDLSLHQQQKLSKLQKDQSLVFIRYMGFSRRFQGINEARQVFSRARKLPRCQMEVFVASALMEFHCCKDVQISSKIFELGYKKFSHDAQFTLEYIKYLSMINDDVNIQAIFNKAVQILPENECEGIWDLVLDYEYKYGEMEMFHKLEEKKASVYDSWFPSHERLDYMGLKTVSEQEKQFMSSTFAVKTQTRKAETLPTEIPIAKKQKVFLNEPVAVTRKTTKVMQPITLSKELNEFISKLPESYAGPIFSVSMIMSLLKHIKTEKLKK